MRCSLLVLLILNGLDLCSGQQPASGLLRVKTDVSAVKVLLDGVEAGETPLRREMAAGKYRLALAKDGYELIERDVEIARGQVTSLFLVMKRAASQIPDLPKQFKVVHSHVLSHCVGVLTVHPDRLDYKSNSANDEFTIPIKSIRLVSLSGGPDVLVGNQGLIGPYWERAANIPCRVEAEGRAYGFLRYVESPDKRAEITAEETSALCRIVYELWMRVQTSKEKSLK